VRGLHPRRMRNSVRFAAVNGAGRAIRRCGFLGKAGPSGPRRGGAVRLGLAGLPTTSTHCANGQPVRQGGMPSGGRSEKLCLGPAQIKLKTRRKTGTLAVFHKFQLRERVTGGPDSVLPPGRPRAVLIS
jgi:hypothetical protein